MSSTRTPNKRNRTSSLCLAAGPVALDRLQREGLHAALFSTLVGASGGPKWFVLYGLDRYLFGDFLAGRQTRLATIGSSAGAWRLACLALADPLAALDRLAGLYSTERYSDRPDSREVTDKARIMLQAVLGQDGAVELVDNQHIHTHVVAARCRGPLNTDSRPVLAAGLALSAASNLISRKALGYYFERVVFNNHHGECGFEQLQDIATLSIRLTKDNIFDALIASGSIPLVLDGVRDVAGGPAGLYVDGGIIDYHFDLPFNRRRDLVLYPHFYPRVVPGWFDKQLPWRQVTRAHYDNVLLVAPSAEFVASLPYGKIPDRNDFKTLGYDDRVRYWQAVLSASQRLGEEFQTLVESGNVADMVRPFDPARHPVLAPQ